MLYIFTGSDIRAAKAKILTLTKSHETVHFGEGAELFENALGYIGARGIFSSNIALVLDHPLDTKEGTTLFENHLGDFVESNVLIVIIQSTIPAALKKKIPKKANIESFDLPQKEELPLPSVFALTDSFIAGDRKKTWILYRKFMEEGSAPEEIHGALSWAVRSLVLAGKAKSAAEAGLKPFVYTKAKRNILRIPLEKAEELSRELVSLYHRARGGQGELEDLLEIFLLKKI
jgi:DNA polymerase III delta subunit